MFTLEQINTAHVKAKSGSDFPEYIRDIKKLGVCRFQTFVTDCHTLYFGSQDFQIVSPGQYGALQINQVLNLEKFRKGLRDNQLGKNSFFEFCTICAESGIAYWIMDLEAMTCTYYDNYGKNVLMEVVPS